MDIDGPQLKQLQEALLSAFPTCQGLEMMVFYGLGKSLSAIVGYGDLEYMIFKLLEWVQAQGRLEELIRVALKQNSQNPQLVYIAELVGLSHDQTALTLIWNIPHLRNPTFIDREELLKQMSDVLKKNASTAPSQRLAISGLGGVGKTQLAVEYAHRHQQDYQAVLWTLSDTRESLISGYMAIAELLDLSHKDEQNQTKIIEAVKGWLSARKQWLLILDNVDDLSIIREFIPSRFDGHILLTTQRTAMGRMASCIRVDIMPEDVGALLLLRRADLIGPDAPLSDASVTDIDMAKTICKELGGLPLALDQAGAYLEETQCSLADYQSLYYAQSAELLGVRGGLMDDHPESVAMTWSFSFQKVEQELPAAADLLRFCAFVHPDAIPEEMIIWGADHLGPHLQAVVRDPTLLNRAIAVLGSYSLVRRNRKEKTLSIHRLVQAVLKDAMDEQTTKKWLKRVVLVVNKVLPDMEFRNWPLYERYLLHTLACVQLIKQGNLVLQEAADLLTSTGWYLGERGRHGEAELLLHYAMAIHEQAGETETISTAFTANVLTCFYLYQGKYAEAELVGNRALSICERKLGNLHPEVAKNINNLACIYYEQGKYTEAEGLYKSALTIRDKTLGPTHLDTAQSLNNLALLYDRQGKHANAESLYKQALLIKEHVLGETHPSVAVGLSNLASCYRAQDKNSDAEPLYRRALTIDEMMYGPDHPEVATDLNNLASTYCEKGRYSEAEPLLERALMIRKQALGPTHPSTAISLATLAQLYMEQSKYTEAESYLQQALIIFEQQLGTQHPSTATCLTYFAVLYESQKKYSKAKPLYERALSIYEQKLGMEHSKTQLVRKQYMSLLDAMK